jgi:predicted GNAT family N-acyltransferase
MEPVVVEIVGTLQRREQAYEIRRRVFRDEQHVPEEVEFDTDDELAVHALASVGGRPAGTGRVVFHTDYAKIGRMAVLAELRRRGVGRAILERLMALATERGATRFVLHAQVHAIPFYEAAGFRVVGDELEEAGIPHRRMERRVQTPPANG